MNSIEKNSSEREREESFLHRRMLSLFIFKFNHQKKNLKIKVEKQRHLINR